MRLTLSQILFLGGIWYISKAQICRKLTIFDFFTRCQKTWVLGVISQVNVSKGWNLDFLPFQDSLGGRGKTRKLPYSKSTLKRLKIYSRPYLANPCKILGFIHCSASISNTSVLCEKWQKNRKISALILIRVWCHDVRRRRGAASAAGTKPG